MPQYRALRDTLIAHEGRIVRTGDVFTTEFPLIKGKPMALSDNLEMVEDRPKRGGKQPDSGDLT